ncbi:hypothetical protein GGX14DRAFT_572363 [Mycena pura]|uniref:Uncharacterized protein n=1 Tax=Mycena pura TaxID=153505 RepID=A0AAD6V0Q1_9AGAR|nr:hypothetical protein GGX14DRAFT_572363 [Mycena pura]
MPVATLPHFNGLVANAIIAHSRVTAVQIIILDNSDKYPPHGIKPPQLTSRDNSDSLSQIQYSTRWPSSTAWLSRAILSALGATALHSVTHSSCTLRRTSKPWKSSAIIVHLLAAGVRLAYYVGIDINPKSEATMRDALVPIIGAKRFKFAYLIADFYKCSADDIPEPPSTPAPDDGYFTRIGPMLSRLTRPGDLLLSEMQVFQTLRSGAAEIIKDFYYHPEMCRFSGLVGRQFDPACSLASGEGDKTEYLLYLVPMQTEVGTVKVATTLISVLVDGAKRYVLTNSCLKYTPDQFNLARQTMGKFVVRKVLETNDKSVVFHITERL